MIDHPQRERTFIGHVSRRGQEHAKRERLD
jgi:hypothetical protein